jgi:hypothetical protein
MSRARIDRRTRRDASGRLDPNTFAFSRFRRKHVGGFHRFVQCDQGSIMAAGGVKTVALAKVSD